MSKTRRPSRVETQEDIRTAWFSRVYSQKNGVQISAPFFLFTLLLCALLLGGLWVAFSPDTSGLVGEVVEEVPVLQVRHALTGEYTEEAVRPAVIAVMIENPVDVRPQSGVDQAFLIYEAPVEGSITRWMALFGADVEAEEIGPVRSARPYYVEWAMAWDAVYAHVGGSPEALQLIRDQGVADLDEFFWGSTFWRSKRTSAPHNVFTEMDRLRTAWDTLMGREVTYADRRFKDPVTEDVRPATQQVTVDFGNAFYDVDWIYDPKTNLYTRSQVGRVSTTRSGAVLRAANIAVVYTDITSIDAQDRKRIRTLGQGEAVLIQDGAIQSVTWKKPTRQEALRFYDAAGEEVAWNPGVTWIEVVPVGNIVQENER